MSPPIQIHSNPGWLKLELMAKGLVLGDGASAIDSVSREEVCGPSLFGNVRDLDLVLQTTVGPRTPPPSIPRRSDHA